MCFDVSIPIRLICSTDGLLCLRSATTSVWHTRCRRGPSTPATVGVDETLTGPDTAPHRPTSWRCIELHGTAQTVIEPVVSTAVTQRCCRRFLLARSSGVKAIGGSRLTADPGPRVASGVRGVPPGAWEHQGYERAGISRTDD